MSRKYLLGIFAFFCLVFIVSVGQASALSKPDLTGQSDTLASYRDFHNSGFALQYPSSWHVHVIPSMSYVRFENLDADTASSLPASTRSQYFKIEVVVLPANGLPLTDWVERQNMTSYPLPKVLSQTQMTLAGEPAIYQVEQFGSLVHPVVFIKKDDGIYLINISNNKAAFTPTVNAFLNNFSFNS